MSTKAETVFDNPQYTSDSVNKVNNFTGDDLIAETYYFKPDQILAFHKHPEGDQVFFILKGQGQFFLDNGEEQIIDVTEGSIVYVPAGVWHQLKPNGEMIASQVTIAGAGMEGRS